MRWSLRARCGSPGAVSGGADHLHSGFTIGGLIALALLLLAPYGGTRFWLTAGALGALGACQLIFWMFTQPVNTARLQDVALINSARRFFGTEHTLAEARDWTVLRAVAATV